jgi:hypothetical protein
MDSDEGLGEEVLDEQLLAASRRRLTLGMQGGCLEKADERPQALIGLRALRPALNHEQWEQNRYRHRSQKGSPLDPIQRQILLWAH